MVSQFLTVAEVAIRDRKTPMSAKEIYDYGRDNGLFSDSMSGRTPWQTIKSKLSVHIRTQGDDSIFVRTSPGRFFVRDLLNLGSDKIYESEPWRPPPSNERVVVFHQRELEQLGRFQGIKLDIEDYYSALFKATACTELDRSVAESDDHHKQILTYILVTRGDDVLCYQRGSYNRTEDMLRGLECVGFGGHVNAQDRDLFARDDAGIMRAAARELNEELKLPSADKSRLAVNEGLKVIGLLNDDSSSVGRRHFAVLLEYQVSTDTYWDRPQRGEKSINKLRWLKRGNDVDLAQFEYWSQLTLRTFASHLIDEGPSFVVVRRRPFLLPHIMCIVGPIGSGKTEAVQLLREQFGYVEINSGRVLATLMNVAPVPETDRVTFQSLAVAFILSADGPYRLAQALADEIRGAKTQRVIIDGIRHVGTYQQLKTLCDIRTNIVYVMTPVDIAFEFYKNRENPDVDFLTFASIRESNVESDVPNLLKLADAVLYNWDDRDKYLSEVRSFLSEVGIREP
ncbi:HTH domain-containing protein [Mycolicibacterium pulveris]|uniref:HTH domain-containing protein n=1 Tax=Mycolicibacterium pulveris TaxID=36813 RepID=UPI003CE830D1